VLERPALLFACVVLRQDRLLSVAITLSKVPLFLHKKSSQVESAAHNSGVSKPGVIEANCGNFDWEAH
jgi:hypothetical protein